MKDVVGFEAFYSVSALGEVFSKRRNKKLIPATCKTGGYSKVSLVGRDGKITYSYIHRIVCTAFLGLDETKTDVNHINGIKSDNRLENLEWCTRKQNIIHAHSTGLVPIRVGCNRPNTKLNPEIIRDIRKAKSEGMRLKDIQQKFEIGKTHAQDIIKGKIWGWVV